MNKWLLCIGLAGGIAWLTFSPSPKSPPRIIHTDGAGQQHSMASHSPSPTTVPRTVTYNDHAPVSAMQSMGGGGGSVPIPIVQLASDELRKFHLNIKQVRPDGTALAYACFYDLPASVTTSPEQLEAGERHWTQGGLIAITGLPSSVIDGQTWVGWLTRDGAKTLTDPLGAYRTMAAYHVVIDPPTVDYKRAPGAWLKTAGGALDQRPAR